MRCSREKDGSKSILKDDLSHRRFRRADFARKVKIYLGSETMLTGVSNDISTHSVSCFISLKGVGEYLSETGMTVEDGQIRFADLKAKLMNQVVLIELENSELEALDMMIARVEPSWKKGFDLFIGGRFCDVTEFLSRKLEMICPKLQVPSIETRERYISEDIKPFVAEMVRQRANEFHYEFTNNYRHIQLHRDLFVGLAKTYDFLEDEVYHLKLIIDELLMNAFLYGSIAPDRDKTTLKILTSPGQIYVSVTDYGGKDFDDYGYHFRKADHLGGLSLVQELTNDWQVTTHLGEFTEVSFFKISADKGASR